MGDVFQPHNGQNDALLDVDEEMDHIVVLTAQEILLSGLREAGYTEARINRVRGNPLTSMTNILRFKKNFGVNHFVVAQLFEDLQTTYIAEALFLPENISLKYLLAALHFLYRYQTEEERELFWDISPNTLRKNLWLYLKKIQALKPQKIVFPTHFHPTDVWIMTVDGIHCCINEPNHPFFRKDTKYFSHKKHGAALCYEIGVCLFTSRVIWVNGPFPAGRNDRANFVEKGLKAKLKDIKKKALGDKIYNGHPKECTTYNAYDNPAVAKFKSRAQMRHEQFNRMLKEYNCLEHKFRHGIDKHKICFEAVSVLCQYRMDHGEPLFELMAGFEGE